MKILVTGATGFLGKNLVEHLTQAHEVATPTRQELDLLDECLLRCYLKANSFDAIIHAAGKPGHRNAADPTGIFWADTRMYFALMHSREYFGRLLIAGSGGIYDLRKYRPKMKEDEWHHHIPADEHGFFRYVTAHHIAASPGVVDLRLFGIFGKYEDYAIRFISNAICKTLFDLPITIKQNRNFDYLYVRDFFPVVDYFLYHDARSREYNVTPDTPISLKELAELILAVSGKKLPVVIFQEGMGLEYSGDNSRLKQELPGLQFTELADAVAELYQWYSDNKASIDRSKLIVDK